MSNECNNNNMGNSTENNNNNDGNEPTVTALQDLIAGGVAGSASVIVGHPFDTFKVRLQTSSVSAKSSSLSGSGSTFGSQFHSLFRGLLAPLSTAAVVNALIFSSYGESSRIWDDYFPSSTTDIDGMATANGSDSVGNANDNNDCKGNNKQSSSKTVWKSFVCGSFAGAVQSIVICPTEHIKCRLQTQPYSTQTAKTTTTTATTIFKGPFDAGDKILSSHGIKGLYRGFACTCFREIPAFGLYFATYDYVKDHTNKLILHYNPTTEDDSSENHRSTSSWAASAIAGGCSGALTWASIYPFDVIKTKIQTAPLDTPLHQRRIHYIARQIVQQHGVKFLFRGLGVTLFRAFPVNGIIFPVYEFTLMELQDHNIGFGGGDGIDTNIDGGNEMQQQDQQGRGSEEPHCQNQEQQLVGSRSELD